jgi:FkbM family methyltransferase
MIQNLLKTYAKLFMGRGTFVSYAQNGEDAVVYALLRSLYRGTYVDVGAYHPTLYSNTYALYKKGWKGIVIDANADWAPLYKALRPRDIFASAGIGATPGVQTYYTFDDGAYNTFDTKEADELKQKAYPAFRGERQVEVKPLSEILAAHSVTAVDFLSIDIEGLDMEALATYNWSMPPRVIAIESHVFNPDAPELDPAYALLRQKGYLLRGMAAYTLIFVHVGGSAEPVV